MIIGVTQQQRKFSRTTGTTLLADDIVIPDEIAVGDTISGTYLFSHSAGLIEDNKPPIARGVSISGTQEEGSILTASFDDLVIPNGGTEGSHLFTWYRALDKQQAGEEVIQEGTTTTYELTVHDVATYIRVEGTPVQVGGANLSGEVVRSTYTDSIAGTSFNPITDIPWSVAFPQSSLSTFDVGDSWTNRSMESSNAIQDGVRNIPSYNEEEDALLFTRSNSENLVFTKENPAITAPYEIYIRFKLNSLTGSQQLIAANNSIFILITSAGAINVSGAATSTGLISTDTWYVLRVLHDGLSTKVEINLDGTEHSLSTSTSSFGTGNARIGSSWGGTNFLDGYISDIYINDTPLTTEEKTNMKNWFGL